MVKSDGWVGVDLDGTLAHYDGWKGPTHIGDPIPAMVSRVQGWLAEGKTVKVFTARVSRDDRHELADVHLAIQAWTIKHIGIELEATCVKDYAMIELWDDRAVGVESNTGRERVRFAVECAIADIRGTVASRLEDMFRAIRLPHFLVPTQHVADALCGLYPPKPAAADGSQNHERPTPVRGFSGLEITDLVNHIPDHQRIDKLPASLDVRSGGYGKVVD